MKKLIPLILILTGCSSAAIKVNEIEGECVLAGTLFTPTVLEQAPPEIDLKYEFAYNGKNCNVMVWSTEDL